MMMTSLYKKLPLFLNRTKKYVKKGQNWDVFELLHLSSNSNMKGTEEKSPIWRVARSTYIESKKRTVSFAPITLSNWIKQIFVPPLAEKGRGGDGGCSTQRTFLSLQQLGIGGTKTAKESQEVKKEALTRMMIQRWRRTKTRDLPPPPHLAPFWYGTAPRISSLPCGLHR